MKPIFKLFYSFFIVILTTKISLAQSLISTPTHFLYEFQKIQGQAEHFLCLTSQTETKLKERAGRAEFFLTSSLSLHLGIKKTLISFKTFEIYPLYSIPFPSIHIRAPTTSV